MGRHGQESQTASQEERRFHQGDGRACGQEEMITILPRPISVSYVTGPTLMVAMSDDYAFLVEADGKMTRATLDTITLDWRFDYENGVWLDIGPGMIGDEDGDEEENDDGGSEVSGRLSDFDGISGSDQGDGEDGANWDLDSGEAKRGGED